MSYRGSFVTEYIHCDCCFEKVKEVLLDNEKYCASIAIPSWSPHDEKSLPIIAGKLGGTWPGSEVYEIEQRIANIKPGRCHDVTVVIIPENEPPVTVVIKADIPKVQPALRVVIK